MITRNRIPPRAFLSSLTSKKLKNWAFLTGLLTTGRKAELVDSIYHNLENNRVRERATWKIVSIDMGIRNMAFCVIEAPSPHHRSLTQRDQIRVKSWVRMDLLKTRGAVETGIEDESGKALEFTEPVAEGCSAGPKDVADIEKGAFEPEMLSRTAYRVTSEVLKHQPDAILIERQRFRSGNAAPIQEWTVRVNMLESMIWACLETLRAQNKSPGQTFPDVIPMSPLRVANYWLAVKGSSHPIEGDLFATKVRKSQRPDEYASTEVASKKTLKPAKSNKEQKVSTVRSWIRGESDVSLDFENECAHIAEAFRLQRKRPASELAGGKLDDLADCLLQAVTWVRWQHNRSRVLELYEEQGPGGTAFTKPRISTGKSHERPRDTHGGEASAR